jgi:membrane-bound metal-dependent hydrolase YbcI (DUF457 family)
MEMKVEPKKATFSLPVGFITMVVLIILKATGHIALGWFWVISSIDWVPLGLLIATLIIIAIVVLIIAIVAAIVGE